MTKNNDEATRGRGDRIFTLTSWGLAAFFFFAYFWHKEGLVPPTGQYDGAFLWIFVVLFLVPFVEEIAVAGLIKLNSLPDATSI